MYQKRSIKLLLKILLEKSPHPCLATPPHLIKLPHITATVHMLQNVAHGCVTYNHITRRFAIVSRLFNEMKRLDDMKSLGSCPSRYLCFSRY
ncbi:hypothetical protein QQG55_46520 [Brugia pahangi]